VRETRFSSPGINEGVLKKIQVNLPFPMLVENLAVILEMGLQPELYFNSHTLDHLSPQEVETTSRAISGKNIPVTFHGPFMDLNPGAVDEKARELTIFRFSQVLELVPYFHPRAIVFHPGYDRWRYDSDVDLWLKNSLLTWKPMVKRAETLSVRIALENVFDENPTPLKRLLDAVDSPLLGYCMDAGHGHLFSEVPLVEWIEVLGPRLMEIHLHDNHRQADEHLPLGRGNIDFPAIFSRIQGKKLHPIYTIEPHEIDQLVPSLQALERYVQ
jgi:sugar phosphate isomerase/epimerase